MGRRGIKICPQCKKEQGVRTQACLCGHKFTIKTSKKIHKKNPKVDWCSLKPGDKISVKKNSGPYMVLLDGSKTCIGHRGIFTVKSLDLNGIHAYGKNGYAFIWMGDKEYSKKTDVYRKPHKIHKMKITKDS